MEQRAYDSKHTILWADDDQDDLDLFRELLHAHAPHHQVIEFANGSYLIEHLKSIPESEYPCLIVLDLNMPVLSGKETLKIIKEELLLELLPVVVFTTSTSPLDKSECDKYAVEMITKPATMDQLRASIQRLLNFCRG